MGGVIELKIKEIKIYLSSFNKKFLNYSIVLRMLSQKSHLQKYATMKSAIRIKTPQQFFEEFFIMFFVFGCFLI